MPSLNILECEQMIDDVYRRITFDQIVSGAPIQSNYGTANPIVTNSGSVIGYDVTTAGPSVSGGSSVNSNLSGGTYGSNSRNFNFNVGTKTEGQITRYAGGATRVGTGSVVKTVAGKLSAGATAVAIGAQLGAKIDSALYNVGKFFDLNPPEELNPQTWDSIATSEGGKSLIRHLFDIEDGSGTLYAPKEAIDYIYDYWNSLNAFEKGEMSANYTPPQSVDVSDVPQPLKLADGSGPYVISSENWDAYREYETTAEYMVPISELDDGTIALIFYSRSPFTLKYKLSPNDEWHTSQNVGSVGYTLENEQLFYYHTENLTAPAPASNYGLPDNIVPTLPSRINIGTVIYDGSITIAPTIPGFDEEPGQTFVDPSQIPSGGSVVDAYPNIFNNPIKEEIPQPDGSTKTILYYPVPLPTDFTTDTPTTGTNTQTDPEISDLTSPEKEIQDMIDWLTDIIPATPGGPTNPTPNVPDTGSGSTPPVIVPTGEASAMWTIYNPTQAQLDAFGGWLWSSNFVDQLKKLFNDPMQAIIGVHKVFAPPSTGSQVNIVCGYIDSGCPAAEVTNQYTTIDCGTVNVREYYGNVFDYAPYTKISLYLPFIGIVDLDVADVMRGSVNVKYHVDVITGACLADVKINRDGESAVLYQYSGSAIVTYPVSSGSYASAVTGVLSLAAGVAGTVMTGGAAAPALIGGAVGLSHIHANVQHSGGFSGAPGAMGGKKPYLIISRAQENNANDFQHYEGKPANKTVKLGDCDGFVKVKSINIDAVPATYGELDQIVSLLKTGVII